jgi:hypothetical protein
MAVTGVMAATDTDMEARASRGMTPHRPCRRQGPAVGVAAVFSYVSAFAPPG